jgi:hypothetical protein
MDELSFLVHLYPKKCWFVSCGVQIWEVTHISPTTKQRHVNRDYRVTKGVTSPASCYHLPRPESESEGYLFSRCHPSSCALDLRPWPCTSTPVLRQLPRALYAGSMPASALPTRRNARVSAPKSLCGVWTHPHLHPCLCSKCPLEGIISCSF